MKKYLTIIFALFLLATSGSAQEELTPMMETIDVRVINIDAVVTDRRGNPVTGLTREDFQLYENGKLQKITNFYEVNLDQREATRDEVEVAEEVAPAPEVARALKRRIVIFIDNLSLKPFNRNRVMDSMKDFVGRIMRPGDEAMIVTWNRSLKTRVAMTSDAQVIQRELDVISGESGLGVHYQSERRQTEDQIQNSASLQQALITARTWAQSVEHDIRSTVGAVNGFLETLGGVEGKKIMVVASEGFQMQPGQEMFYYIDDIRREKSEWGNFGGSSLFESMAFNTSRLIQSVATTANENDITIYTVHAAGLSGLGVASAENRRPRSMQVEQAALSNSTQSLRLMADLTGGIATVGTNNFEKAFDEIERDLSSYYSLGYSSPIQRVDRQRSIEVKTSNPDYRVRSRRTFVEKSIETEMTDKVVANLFYASSENDLGIHMRTGRQTRLNPEQVLVPLEVMIPIDQLTMLPGEDGIHRGRFSLWVVVADQRGDMSDVSTQSHTVALTDEQLEEMKGRYYTFETDMRMRTGRHTISVGVLDDLAKVTGFRQQPLMANAR